MDLAQTYSLQCGLKIDKPYIDKKFTSLPVDYSKAILIHAGGGNNAFPSKIYSNYDEVISLLNPILEPLGYKFFQIGGKNEPRLREAYYICGETSFQQTAFLLENAALFIGNDSMNAHIRASFGMPSIALYGPTSVREHGPHWKSTDNVCLESHRNGNMPSFSATETIKTIDFIKPETVAKQALSLLGVNAQIKHNTLFLGEAYQDMLFEIVPDHIPDPNFVKGTIFTVRMDYLHEPSAIAQIADKRRINIVSTDYLPLDDLKKYKSNIVGIIQEVTSDTDLKYIERLKRIGVSCALFSKEKDENKLNDLRVKLFDNFTVELAKEKTKQNVLDSAKIFTNNNVDIDLKIEETYFKSNKFLLSDGKVFLSKAHYFANQPTSSFEENFGKVIDNSDFWLEQDYLLIYTK